MNDQSETVKEGQQQESPSRTVLDSDLDDFMLRDGSLTEASAETLDTVETTNTEPNPTDAAKDTKDKKPEDSIEDGTKEAETPETRIPVSEASKTEDSQPFSSKDAANDPKVLRDCSEEEESFRWWPFSYFYQWWAPILKTPVGDEKNDIEKPEERGDSLGPWRSKFWVFVVPLMVLVLLFAIIVLLVVTMTGSSEVETNVNPPTTEGATINGTLRFVSATFNESVHTTTDFKSDLSDFLEDGFLAVVDSAPSSSVNAQILSVTSGSVLVFFQFSAPKQDLTLISEDELMNEMEELLSGSYMNILSPYELGTDIQVAMSSLPTMKPSSRPTDKPTFRPTLGPTFAPILPSKQPTQHPTVSPSGFPSPSPTRKPSTSAPSSGDQTMSPTGTAAFQSVSLMLLQDFSFVDGKYLGRSYNQLNGMYEGKNKEYRLASPDTIPSRVSLLTGKYPAALGVHGSSGKPNSSSQGIPSLNLRNNNHLTLFFLLKEAGYIVGHFGEWGLEDNLDDLVDVSFVTNDPILTKDSAIEWVQERIKRNEKYFLSIWWPVVDVTFGLGAEFDIKSWNRGVEGPVKNGDTCSDVVRSESGTHYETCPRQIYLANRKYDLDLVAEVAKTLEGNKESHLSLLTSSSSIESEQVNGHSSGVTNNRGQKRSLYEGGIKSEFWYTSFGPKVTESIAKGTTSLTAINSVDILPTLASILGLETRVSSLDIDGVNVWNALKEGGTSLVERSKLQTWEWRFSVPGHCRNEAPRFAILDKTGRFKLLVEPAVGDTYTWDEAPLRLELYDLSRAKFELINWANPELINPSLNERVLGTRDYLFNTLKTWVQTLPSNSEEDEGVVAETTVHKGCELNFNEYAKGQLPEPSSKKLKGIVVLLADDFAVGDMSWYNHDSNNPYPFDPYTPELDSLANEGVTFANFYSNSGVCSPTRASVLTGRYPSHKRVRMHAALNPSSKLNNERGTVTYLGEGENVDTLTILSKAFQDNGWVTGHFGKWHLGFGGDSLRPDNAFYGIDEYQVYAHNEWPNDDKTVQFPTASKVHEREFNNQAQLFPAYSTQLIINRTIDFIRDRINSEKENFFVNVWLQNSHAPLNVALDYDQVGENGYPSSNNPFYMYAGLQGRDKKIEDALPLQAYRALAREHSRGVMRLVDFVDANDLGEEVLFLYTSDNGPESPHKYFMGKGSAGPFRGDKRSLYEGGIRVPGFARWKGHIPEQRIVMTPASTIDIYPTVLKLADLNLENVANMDTVQGRDLSCLLIGTCSDAEWLSEIQEDASQSNEGEIIWERREDFAGDCLSWSARFSVRWENYKLHLQPEDKTEKRVSKLTKWSRLELYDLSVDSMESTNLLLVRPADPMVQSVTNHMIDLLTKYTESSAYDTSLWPKSVGNNRDFTRANFDIGLPCWDFNSGSIPDAMEDFSLGQAEFASLIA